MLVDWINTSEALMVSFHFQRRSMRSYQRSALLAATALLIFPAMAIIDAPMGMAQAVASAKIHRSHDRGDAD
jgi:hypothetical protein